MNSTQFIQECHLRMRSTANRRQHACSLAKTMSQTPVLKPRRLHVALKFQTNTTQTKYISETRTKKRTRLMSNIKIICFVFLRKCIIVYRRQRHRQLYYLRPGYRSVCVPATETLKSPFTSLVGGNLPYPPTNESVGLELLENS